MKSISLSMLSATLIFLATQKSNAQEDIVHGNLIQFNDNGAWCWYQDERSVIDFSNNLLIVGSVGNGSGTGGNPHDGSIEVVTFNLQSMTGSRFQLKNALTSYGGGDDHNAPAFLVRPNGGYLAMYAGHNNDNITFYRNFNGTSWGAEQRFDWNAEVPGGTDFPTTYNNIYYLSSEDRIYNFVRTDEKSPNFMYSTNGGTSWSYGGQLTMQTQSIGYVNGYFRYNSNGVDRIDFIATDYHPRDYNTNIYHGYVQNQASYNSTGNQLDGNIYDKNNEPRPSDFTTVFAANTQMNGVTMDHCWNIDVQRYSNGTVATIFKCRANNNENDHRFLYARFANNQWTTTYLGRAGAKLYGSEQDYTGLGALDPNDPSTIYISSTYNPSNNQSVGVHEIFEGTTSDNGANWSWTAITENSTRDNLRPIVPDWDSQNTILQWMRGTYNSAQNIDAVIVGIFRGSFENANLKTYVDATTTNTTLENGNPLNATGPSGSQGAADGNWHWRTGQGNGDDVLASAESGGENAPVIRTSATIPQAGTYDVWVNFWADPGADWRIEAGLAANQMQIFRHMASQQVENGQHTNSLTLTSGTNSLYQAYVGRVTVAAGGTINVYIDDEAVAAGSQNQSGNTVRTWYDGISYANTLATVGLNESQKTLFHFKVRQKPNGNQTAVLTYTLAKSADVQLKIFDITGKEVSTLVKDHLPPGIHEVEWKPDHIASGLFFYELIADGATETRKLVLK